MERLDELRAELKNAGFAALCLIVAAACVSSEEEPAERPGAPASIPQSTVDSILPVEEATRRFLEGIPPLSALRGGARSVPALVDSLNAAVTAGDTAALRRLVINRGEYGYLYYPRSVYTREPYHVPPQIAWMLNSGENEKAIRRLAGRRHLRSARFHDVACTDTVRAGALVVQSGCSVLALETRHRLFKSILEWENRVKFLSLAGDM